MKFIETRLPGAYVIEPEKIVDERGFFARIWCEQQLRDHGLQAVMVQSNMGVSRQRGTLRGLHFQQAPHREVKLVRCPRGAIFNVIVDLRPDSPTFKQWCGAELTAENSRMLYVPEGFAQGYLTLSDDTEMYYHTSHPYAPASASGIRYDDPAFGVELPEEVRVISAQDRNWPDFAS